GPVRPSVHLGGGGAAEVAGVALASFGPLRGTRADSAWTAERVPARFDARLRLPAPAPGPRAPATHRPGGSAPPRRLPELPSVDRNASDSNNDSCGEPDRQFRTESMLDRTEDGEVRRAAHGGGGGAAGGGGGGGGP